MLTNYTHAAATGDQEMSTRDVIIQKLSARFEPVRLEVIDESDRHRGHSGWREGGETHFRVRIATGHFAGQSRLTQHRAIMQELQPELQSGVHALAIEVLPIDGVVAPAPRIEQ